MSDPKSYLRFEIQPQSQTKVTREWRVLSGSPPAQLGGVSWYSPWRRYVYWPASSQVLDASCLTELAAFCGHETEKRKRGAAMPHHFTKNTVEASFWCKKCGKDTPHEIWDGRCMELVSPAAQILRFRDSLWSAEVRQPIRKRCSNARRRLRPTAPRPAHQLRQVGCQVSGTSRSHAITLDCHRQASSRRFQVYESGVRPEGHP